MAAMTKGPRYHRLVERPGPLPLSTQIFQGLGALPEAVKNFAFNTFLLLFYNQVLSVPASWASLVLMLAVLIDAVTDPVVGSFSDGIRSRLGRRHGLMYASVLPLGLSLYFLFVPPVTLGHVGLILWLGFFTISARVSMTFFQVPWSALFVELTDDYVERSAVVTWRWALGILGVALFTAFVWGFIFAGDTLQSPETVSLETAPSVSTTGQLDAANYKPFAIILACVVMTFALLSTLLTQRDVKYLPQPIYKRRFSLVVVLADLRMTLKNRNFMLLFFGLLMTATLTGTVEALRIYLNTYFWGLGPEDMKWFALAAIGAFAALAVIPTLNKKFDKKRLLIVTMCLSVLNAVILISLRLLDILPENGDPNLLIILVADTIVTAFLVVIVGTMFVSMTADATDEQDYLTGQRQEGVFSAAVSFSNKAISGFGILIAGVLLDTFIGFPENISPADLSDDARLRLGLVLGYGLPLLYLLPLFVLKNYNITRESHEAVVAELKKRRASMSGQPSEMQTTSLSHEDDRIRS